MNTASLAHMKAMCRVMAHCVATPERALSLKPTRKWDGNPDFEFEIVGMTDSNHATNVATQRSVSGCSAFIEGAPLSMKSSGQKSVALSTAEAELALSTSCSQDMLHEMRVLELIELKVKKTMILHNNDKGAVDLMNNWSVGGRTHHIEVRQCLPRELKDQGVIVAVWCTGDIMSSDVFTKNLERPLFKRHAETFCGKDQRSKSTKSSQGESVGE
jgi:hypothetical protein